MSPSRIPPTAIDIAISGMRAQSERSRAISNNIANSRTTRTGGGKPFRRQVIPLQAGDGIGGVTFGDVMGDQDTPFTSVLSTGHPDADANGYVQYPNVTIAQEMVSLMDASRAYQANAAVLKRQMELSNTALELLR